MKTTIICLALLAGATALHAQSTEGRTAYLQWMQQSLPEVPEWNQWQQKTGELPPDFTQLPRQNLLPDPFLFLDGRKVEDTPQSWEARRVEIRSLFEKYVTGTFPAKPPIDKVVVLDQSSGEGYTVTNVRVEFGPQGKGSVRIRLVVPQGSEGQKFPVLISPNLAGWAPSLIRRGYISAGYAGNDFMDDAAPLKELYPDYDFSALSRRAWLSQIVLDYLETVPQVDMERVAIFGYSRDGKMATIAAMLDERISALVAGSTGVGGFVPWRLSGERGGGESIESTTRMFPDWLAARLRFFSGHEDRLPVDANLFLALIAPRAVLMEWGLSDQVANGWAQEQAYHSAQKVYERLGEPNRLGLLPIPGFHGSNDQQACIDWLDWQFGRTDKKWVNTFVFPWSFDKWLTLSGEKADPAKYPIHEKDSKATLSKAKAKQWSAQAPEIRRSVEWMLGDKPTVMAPSTEVSPMIMRRPTPAGVTEVAKGHIGNPGQLAPDVPAWVIAGGGVEYGWLEPEKNMVESRRVRFQDVTGDLFYPAGTPEGQKLPTVIWLHGFHHPLGYMWVYRRDLHPILALVKAGYAVLAYDQSGYGMRCNEAGPFYDRYPHWSRLGKMVEDVSFAVDALQKEAVVDADNISVYGYTLGGTVGLYAAALDERIQGVVSICGFTPMRTDTPEKGMSGAMRYCHQHGLLPRLGFFQGNESRIPYDYEDILALIAPRPVLVVQPMMDRDADPKDVRDAVSRARSLYSLQGAADKLGLQEPDDYGRLTNDTQNKAIEWMKTNIQHKNN